MSKFERVLSDDWLPLEFKSGNDVPVTSLMVNLKTLKSIVEQTEQAVLAKLAEQEPGATHLLKALERIANMDSMSYHSLDSAKITARNALAAHPMPCVSTTSDKTACVLENAESDTQHHLSYLKRYQKWRRGEDKTMDEAGLTPKQIGEALDWLITFAENHIPDASKMVDEVRTTLLDESRAKIMAAAQSYADNLVGVDRGCGMTDKDVVESHRDLELRVSAELAITRENASELPDGWQLAPKEPTDEMHTAARDWSAYKYSKAIGLDASLGCYKAMLAAAPKYTGESK